MLLRDSAPDNPSGVAALVLPLELSRRLEALGMTGSSQVRVLRKKRRGAMIITVRGTRFAVGMDIARHITVKEGP